MQVTFFLDTTGEHFAHWLENYTNDAPYRDFSTERGMIILQSARPPYSITGPTNIKMDGFYTKLCPNNDAEVGQHLPSIILFKVVPLARAPGSDRQMHPACDNGLFQRTANGNNRKVARGTGTGKGRGGYF
jgi:hypothetical protein